MLSMQFIRENPDAVHRSLILRHTDAPVDEALSLDEDRRCLLGEVEKLKADRNKAGKVIGKANDKVERDQLIAAQREAADRIDELDTQLRDVDERLRDALSQIPNLVDDSVPEGEGEEQNVVLREVGEPRTFDFEPKPHWELGEALGIIEFEAAATMSGSRMYALRGKGAHLQRALIGYFLEAHESNGYTEMYVPAMVREESMWASGQLPKFRDNLYHDAEEDYWLIPTAEVPLTNLHRDTVFEEADLPLRYAAHTPCFRREKMSAGRDVRGMKRVHQFEKVEMYQFTTPEQSQAAHAEMLAAAESLLQDLGLAYRVVQLSSGDLGFSARIGFDLEVWSPGVADWVEVSSISNCGTFQARRANVRVRSEERKPEFVHTLNGSGLPTGRVLAAILETYQVADGSVAVPEVLQHRMGRLMQITA